jgi:hypothetical protein
LAQTYPFKDDRLAQAIAATFARRKTAIPTERPDGLTSAFASDPTKQQQWAAFIEEVAVMLSRLSQSFLCRTRRRPELSATDDDRANLKSLAYLRGCIILEDASQDYQWPRFTIPFCRLFKA